MPNGEASGSLVDCRPTGSTLSRQQSYQLVINRDSAQNPSMSEMAKGLFISNGSKRADVMRRNGE
jgi:hypothetical protein